MSTPGILLLAARNGGTDTQEAELRTHLQGVTADSTPLVSLSTQLAGDELVSAAKAEAEKAGVVIVLLTAHLLALFPAENATSEGDRACAEALRIALVRRSRGEVDIVLVVARACDWRPSPELADLEPTPEDRPLPPAGPEADLALRHIASEVGRLLARRAGTSREVVLDAVRFSYFDFHLLTASPLFGSNRWPEPAAFLGNQPEYDTRYRSSAPLVTRDLTLRPLRRNGELYNFQAPRGSRADPTGGNAFWKAWASLLPPGATEPQPWSQLLPFLATPRGQLRLEHSPGPGARPVRVEARLAALVWPFGWSSRVDVDLRGPVHLDEAARWALRFRRSSPFVWRGPHAWVARQHGPTELFKLVESMVLPDLYGVVGPHPQTRRLSVATIVSAFTRARPGEARSYSETGEARLSDAERAAIQTILRGKHTGLARCLRLEDTTERDYSVVPLEGRCFAVLHQPAESLFRTGCFLFLGNDAAQAGEVARPGDDPVRRERRTRRARVCAATNIRVAGQTTAAMGHLVREGRELSATGPEGGAVVASAGRALQRWQYHPFHASHWWPGVESG